MHCKRVQIIVRNKSKSHVKVHRAPKPPPQPRRLHFHEVDARRRMLDSKIQSFNFHFKKYRQLFGMLKNLSNKEWQEVAANDSNLSNLTEALEEDYSELLARSLKFQQALDKRGEFANVKPHRKTNIGPVEPAHPVRAKKKKLE